VTTSSGLLLVVAGAWLLSQLFFGGLLDHVPMP
jgi:hypothetical protein